MDRHSFEEVLDATCALLTDEAQAELFTSSKQFEDRVREVLADLLTDQQVELHPPAQCFPDIALGEFGVEVKFTLNDTWRSVANSIFEGQRDPDVRLIYVVFGKMGGHTAVRWDRYEDCVMHVRTSHVPRFELEIGASQSLFKKMDVDYERFSELAAEEKMHYVREYARGRLKDGERLWWLEEKDEPEHSLPMAVRLYMDLEQDDKRRFRAEAALLCPQVVKPSRSKHKYDDAALYLLTYYGILCSQARDLFSAGSVAMRGDDTRGGNYVERAIADIQGEMIEAAWRLEDALFQEYWGEIPPPEERIDWWLKRADDMAIDWKPSERLFANKGRRGPRTHY
ncbi:MAG: restriction endonuclease [Coriobacteriia bacterium]|nr:restriction endonuclease [Coriobacteriia bacterium]